MTALNELQSDDVGPAFLSLLQQTFRAVGVARNFPAPDGYDVWDTDAVKSVVAEFLACPQTPRRLTALALYSRTDDALKRQLQSTVRNFLADSGRRTPVGRLVLRVNEVLTNESRFERQGSCWALVGTDAERAGIDFDALVSASASVDIVIPTAWSVGERQSPEIDHDSVVRLADSVLGTAGGPVSAAVIAKVAARRLGVGAAPLSLEANALDPPQPSAVSSDATSDAALIEIRAHEVFSVLNDSERVALGRANFPTAELGRSLGVSKSTAANIRKRAVSILSGELSSEEGGQAVADLVLDLARDWTDFWTDSVDATY